MTLFCMSSYLFILSHLKGITRTPSCSSNCQLLHGGDDRVAGWPRIQFGRYTSAEQLLEPGISDGAFLCGARAADCVQRKVHHGWSHAGGSCPHSPYNRLDGHCNHQPSPDRLDRGSHPRPSFSIQASTQDRGGYPCQGYEGQEHWRGPH